MLILTAMWALLAPPAAACVPTDLEAGVRQLTELRSTSEDMSTAVRLAEELESGLLCSESLFQPKSLTDFYQQAGAAAMTAGDQQKALHWLTEACRLDPDAEWDVRLGKQAGATWELARRTCADLVFGRLRADSPVWVNGRLIQADGMRSMRSGRHLIQTVDCRTGQVVTSQVFVSADQEEVLGDVADLACVAEPPSARPSRQGPRVVRVGATSLIGLGTAGLVSAAMLASHYGSDSYVNQTGDYSREEARLTALTYGGIGMIGLGVTGLLVDPRPTMTVGFHWKY